VRQGPRRRRLPLLLPRLQGITSRVTTYLLSPSAFRFCT
jgi:hypothetical protein